MCVTTVLYLNRVKIDGEGTNSSDLGTVYTLLIVEETAARLCLTRGDGGWTGRCRRGKKVHVTYRSGEEKRLL